MTLWRKRLAATLNVVLLGIAALGVALSFASLIANDAPEVRGAVPPSFTDTVAVLLISSACPACTSDDFKSRVRTAVNEEANAPKPHFRYVGIAVDWDVQNGLKALQAMGHFSEVSAGNSWWNTTALDLTSQDSLGVLGVPQVLLVARELGTTADSTRVFVVSDTLLSRAIGVSAVLRFLEARKATE